MEDPAGDICESRFHLFGLCDSGHAVIIYLPFRMNVIAYYRDT